MKRHPRRKQAQANLLIGLMLLFAALAIVSVLMEPMLIFIELGQNATEDTENAGIIASLYNLIPLFLVLVLIIFIFMLARGG